MPNRGWAGMKLQCSLPGSENATSMKVSRITPAALVSASPNPESPATRRGGAMVGSSELWNTVENSNDILPNATSAPTKNSAQPVECGMANHIKSDAAESSTT